MPFHGLRLGVPGSLGGASDPPAPPNTLVAKVGRFHLSGDTMSPAYAMGADVAAFVLAGVAAAFVQGTLPVLAAGTGVFTLTGIAAGLIGANTIAAQPASFIETGVAAGLNISMPAAHGTFTFTGVAATLTAPSAYTGPGDVVSGAAAWWGLRAYNAAYATGSNPAVDITDQALANALTVNILANGNLDVATISAWVTAHGVTAIKIAKLYDQTGNGKHIVQTDSFGLKQPTLTLSAVGSFPGMTFDSSHTQQLLSTTTFTTTQPFSMVAAAAANAAGASLRVILGLENQVLLASDSGAQLIEADAGSNLFAFLMVPGQFYSYDAMYNSTSSVVTFTGSNTNTATGDAGTNAPSGTKFEMGYDTGGVLGNAFDGVILEAGFWPGDKSGSFSSMTTNQRAYWGY